MLMAFVIFPVINRPTAQTFREDTIEICKREGCAST